MPKPHPAPDPALLDRLKSPIQSAPAAFAISSGWPGLDAWLGGGWPAGSLSELRGQGRSSLALAALRQALGQALPAAWVDGTGGFSPAAAGELLGRLDLVRPGSGTLARARDSREDVAHDALISAPAGQARSFRPLRGAAWRALQAADLLLRSRAHALLVLDMPPGSAPASAFFRLDRLARRARAAVLLLQDHRRSLAGSAAPRLYEVSLRPEPGVRLDPGVNAPWLVVRVLRHRGGPGEGELLLRPQAPCARSEGGWEAPGALSAR